MAIYRLFPEKDTFIYTDQLTGNAGKDEIVELGGYPGTDATGHTARLLVQYSDAEIDDVIANTIGSTNFSSSLKMYLADASELPTQYSLNAYPIYTNNAQGWDNGVGKFGDIPVNTSGVSWTYIQSDLTNQWSTSGFPTFVTASYRTSKEGGATWYTASNGQSMEFTQTHNISSDHDVDINVTEAVKQIYNDQLDNKGFIVKMEDAYEFHPSSSIRLKYFGKDTNTIYPPFLEFKWDDRVYNQGTLDVLSTDQAVIDVKNNKGRYTDTGKQRFKLTSRPQYPARTFTTSSVYLVNHVLPSASYWGIRDENTEEMIVDFDTDFTKISCNPEGSYFDVYMGGLQPERYYRLLVKTQLDGSTVVIDNDNVFKVVRNG